MRISNRPTSEPIGHAVVTNHGSVMHTAMGKGSRIKAQAECDRWQQPVSGIIYYVVGLFSLDQPRGASPEEQGWDYESVIDRWTDGDSGWMTPRAEVDFGFRASADHKHKLEFRLWGLDTPERGDNPGYTDAKNFVNDRWPAGSIVQVKTYKPRPEDKYKRWLVQIVEDDGRTSDQILIEAGLAKPYFGGTRVPNIKSYEGDDEADS